MKKYWNSHGILSGEKSKNPLLNKASFSNGFPSPGRTDSTLGIHTRLLSNGITRTCTGRGHIIDEGHTFQLMNPTFSIYQRRKVSKLRQQKICETISLARN